MKFAGSFAPRILVDVGNTTVCWYSDHRIDRETPIRVESISTAELLSGRRPLPPSWHGSTLIVSSVVPKVDALLRTQNTFDLRFVSYRDFPEISLAMDDPTEIGIDRIVNVSSAFRFTGTCPLVVVDFGTATTFDVLDAAMRYVGGIIAPGIALSRDILNERTAKLPKIELFRPDHVIGHNTKDAMAAGLIRAYEAMVDGMVQEIENELGQPINLTLTGGYASLLQIKHPHQVIKHLWVDALKQIGR